MTSEPLKPRMREILSDVLRPYRARLTRVALFGLCAMGTARPGSDIDLVLWGDLTGKDVDRIASDLEESCLRVTVDAIAYPLLDHAALRRHIDLVALNLALD